MRKPHVSLLSLFLLLCSADAFSQNVPSRSAAQTAESNKNNLAITIDSPTIREVSVDVSGPGIKTPLHYALRAGRGSAGAGLQVPPGNDRRFVVQIMDEKGKATHFGMVKATVKQASTPAVRVTLMPLRGTEWLTASLGTYRLDVQQEPAHAKPGQDVTYQVQVLNPNGKAVNIREDQITLRGANAQVLHPKWHGKNPPNRPRFNVSTVHLPYPLIVCWQLGTCIQLTAAVVPQLPFKSVVSGSQFSCALDSNDLAWCWGFDFQGQLGNSAPPSCLSLQCSATPVPVAPVNVSFSLQFQSISAGFSFTCGVDAGSVAWCWGDDTFGSLGSTSGPFPPSRVGGAPFASAHKFQSVSAGFQHACGVTTDNLMFCWGDNTHGQLGIGGTNPAGPPSQVNLPGKLWSKVSAGVFHTCAITTDSQMYCWGSDENGELAIDFTATKTDTCVPGDATSFCVRVPTNPVPPLNGASGSWDRVSAGGGFTCGRDANGGKTFCWGKNDGGQLGSGSISSTPLGFSAVNFNPVLARLASAVSYTCAIPFIVNGPADAVCWGSAPFLGVPWPSNNTNSANPLLIPGIVFFDTAPGYDHMCALDRDGAVWCWGFGTDGQLGNGSFTDSRVPVQVVP
jgi:alpha-tubulin suppressor-like RCC1 family protein